MGFVVVRIEVNIILIRVEKYLGFYIVGIVMIEKVVMFSLVGVFWMIIVVIEIDIGDSGRVWIIIDIFLLERVIRYYMEVIREGLDCVFVWRIVG